MLFISLIVASVVANAQDVKYEPTPFKVNISNAKLEEIQKKVEGYRWPVSFDQGNWSMGADFQYMKELVEYWSKDYDWRRFETKLNQYPQYIVNINGIDLHYYHIKSEQEGARPLLISHGWPGSPAEYFKTIDGFINPSKYGSKSQPFDLVLPSLPGYGFSGKPANMIGPKSTAELYHVLMTKVLGYNKFFSAAGDLGGLVQTQLAQLYPEDLIAIHYQNLAVGPSAKELTQEEKEWTDKSNAYAQQEMTYFPMQLIKPMTVALTLQDNPVGSAAWFLEKIQIWSDHKGDIENSFSKDDLLDMVMYYLVNDNMGSSINFYGGLLRETNGAFYPEEKIDIPTALIHFPKDYLNAHPPRSWAEQYYNIQQWSKMAEGGHFPGMEAPEEFVADVQNFFSKY